MLDSEKMATGSSVVLIIAVVSGSVLQTASTVTLPGVCALVANTGNATASAAIATTTSLFTANLLVAQPSSVLVRGHWSRQHEGSTRRASRSITKSHKRPADVRSGKRARPRPGAPCDAAPR